MKRNQPLVLLILLLTFISVIVPLAGASEDLAMEEVLTLEWEYLASDAEKTTYILKNSVKYSGKDIIEVSYLWDYKLQQIGQADRKFMSMKQSSKFSCKSHTAQLGSVSLHAEKMGGGALVATANLKDQPWVKIVPLSAREAILKYFCTKK
jgi:hypothetical protein